MTLVSPDFVMMGSSNFGVGCSIESDIIIESKEFYTWMVQYFESVKKDSEKIFNKQGLNKEERKNEMVERENISKRGASFLIRLEFSLSFLNSREQMYKKLSFLLNMKDFHFRESDIELCKKVLNLELNLLR